VNITPAAMVGWRLELPVQGQSVEIDFILDIDAPYSKPRVVLVHPPRPLTWPHVEDDGKLCLAPDGAAVVSLPNDSIVSVAGSFLRAAHDLVSDCVRGRRREDFLVEWPTYWGQSAKPAGPEFLSLLSLMPPSRLISLWRRTGLYLLADDRAEGERWLHHAQGTTTEEQDEPAALVWLERPPYPDEFPADTLTLLQLTRTLSEDGAAVFERLAAVRPEPLVVVLAAKFANRIGAAGLAIAVPGSGPLGGREIGRGVYRGFRAGHVPEAVKRARYLSFAPGLRSVLRRVDAAWIHGRDRSPEVVALREKRVVLIGCGSLGAPVGRMLVQAGVGSVVLLDGDNLDWPNISRHPLGADQIDKNKAKSLAERLRTEFPHVREVLGLDTTWQEALRKNPQLFDPCDLVIAASGDWNSESALNDMQRATPGFAPIVYGWLEERAAAAHAVVVGSAGACLRCGHSDVGKPVTPVTVFPAEPQHEGACAAPSSPYGAAAASHAQGLVTELAVDVLMRRAKAATHRVWIAPRRLLEQEGGTWSAPWIRAHGDPHDGGTLLDLVWPQDPNCVLCSLPGAA